MNAIKSQFARRGALFLCWTIVFFIGVGHIIHHNSVTLNPNFGWDATVECAGVSAFEQKMNPYYVKNIIPFEATKTDLSFPYLPTILAALSPFCSSGFLSKDLYRWSFSVLAVCMIMVLTWCKCGLLPVWERVACTSSLVLCGFSGFAWTIRTGNIAIIDGMLLAVALSFLVCGSGLQKAATEGDQEVRPMVLYAFGVALLGLSASIKLVFAPALLGLFFLPVSGRRKILLILISAFIFSLTIVLSFLVYPDLFVSWFAAITGHIPEQHSPLGEGETFSIHYITHTLLERVLDNSALQDFGGWVGYALAVVAVTGGGFFTGYRLLNDHGVRLTQNPDFGLYMVATLMFGISLCSPRLKDYGFLNLAIEMAIPTMFLSGWKPIILTVCSVILPLCITLVNLEYLGLDKGIACTIAALVCYGVMLVNAKAVLRSPADRRSIQDPAPVLSRR